LSCLAQQRGIATTELRNVVQHELVAIIADGEGLAPGITSPDYGAYVIWRDKAAAFVRTVFGVVERQRFGDPDDPAPDGLSGALAQRLQRLRALRDRLEMWELRVDQRQLSKAVSERRARDAGDLIITAEHRARSAVEPEFIHALTAEIAHCQDIRAVFAAGNFLPFATAETVWGPIGDALDWAMRVEGLLREKAPQWLPEFQFEGFEIPSGPESDQFTVEQVEGMLAARLRVLGRIIRGLEATAG
jgi:hypothetical protein